MSNFSTKRTSTCPIGLLKNHLDVFLSTLTSGCALTPKPRNVQHRFSTSPELFLDHNSSGDIGRLAVRYSDGSSNGSGGNGGGRRSFEPFMTGPEPPFAVAAAAAAAEAETVETVGVAVSGGGGDDKHHDGGGGGGSGVRSVDVDVEAHATDDGDHGRLSPPTTPNTSGRTVISVPTFLISPPSDNGAGSAGLGRETALHSSSSSSRRRAATSPVSAEEGTEPGSHLSQNEMPDRRQQSASVATSRSNAEGTETTRLAPVRHTPHYDHHHHRQQQQQQQQQQQTSRAETSFLSPSSARTSTRPRSRSRSQSYQHRNHNPPHDSNPPPSPPTSKPVLTCRNSFPTPISPPASPVSAAVPAPAPAAAPAAEAEAEVEAEAEAGPQTPSSPPIHPYRPYRQHQRHHTTNLAPLLTIPSVSPLRTSFPGVLLFSADATSQVAAVVSESPATVPADAAPADAAPADAHTPAFTPDPTTTTTPTTIPTATTPSPSPTPTHPTDPIATTYHHHQHSHHHDHYHHFHHPHPRSQPRSQPQPRPGHTTHTPIDLLAATTEIVPLEGQMPALRGEGYRYPSLSPPLVRESEGGGFGWR